MNRPDRSSAPAAREAAAQAPHLPVLLAETLQFLAPQPGRTYLDATFGAGGHSRALLDAGAAVVAIDQDPLAAKYAARLGREYGDRFHFRQGNFRNLRALVLNAGFAGLDGALFDLGVSSMQLDREGRGFSYRQPGPLDMRMSQQGPTAADLIRELPAEELAAIIYRYGEERHSRRIARAIVKAREERPITTTTELAAVIERAMPPGRRRDHPARRTFQALRIYLNDELTALRQALEQTRELLTVGGRLVVLSYHSLEDRIVKRFFADDAALEPLTKKPLTASPEEVARNPRARSAKLRAAEKVTA